MLQSILKFYLFLIISLLLVSSILSLLSPKTIQRRMSIPSFESIESVELFESIHSFKARNFYPISSLFNISSNCHYQTIIGSGALTTKLFGNHTRKFNIIKERFQTDDNDFFDVEYTINIENIHETKGLVFICHGLESSIQSTLVTRMVYAFLERNFCCCLVSFRGCNGEENLTPGGYHLGFTKDLRFLLESLRLRYNINIPFYLSGFSLGGNVILKLLGELGQEAMEWNIIGACVTCVPFDPIASQGKIDRGINRAIYSENFLDTLKKKAEKQYKRFPNVFDINKVRQCKTIGDFDDVYIAKIYNFIDKYDYYRKSGSKWWLSKIRVPTIAINAKDDPFIEDFSLPTSDDIGEKAPFRLILHQHGGHCGFIADQKSFHIHNGIGNGNCDGIGNGNGNGIGNGNCDGIGNTNTNSNTSCNIPDSNKYGWLQDEMARVLEHFHDHYMHTKNRR